MSTVKLVTIRRDVAGDMTKRIITTPKKANVIQEGIRGADHMDATLSVEHDVQQGDEVYYLQDVLNLDNLRGMWNFYGSFRDESGFEQDDVYSGTYSLPAAVDRIPDPVVGTMGFKFDGFYKFKINTSSNDGVQIEKKFGNNDTNAATKIPVINLSSDFDMFFWFKAMSNTGANTTIFDDYDHATSKGLKLQIDTSLNTVTITVNDGTGVNTMVASSITTLNEVSLLRIVRQNGVFKLYVNNVVKTLTNSSFSGNLNSNNNIHFFKEYNESTSSYVGSTGFVGMALQFRFYNKALDDDEAKKLYISKPQSTTMKFGGTVWKINNSGISKKLVCSSFGKEILGSFITAKTFASATTATLAGGGKRKDNVYYNPSTTSSTSNRPDFEEIIGDILKYISSGVYVYYQDEPSTNCQGDFVAEGLFLDILKVMFVMDGDNHIFNILPRKVLFINKEVQTNYVISDTNYNLLFSGKDDTNTTNSVSGSARFQLYSGQTTKSSYGGSINQFTPETELLINGFKVTSVKNITKVTRDGTIILSSLLGWQANNPTTNSWVFDSANNKMKFWSTDSNSHTYVIDFTYSNTAHPSLSHVQTLSDSTSINTIGVYHRNLNVPQLVSGFDLSSFINNYISDNKTINLRITAFTTSLINSLSVGQKVYIHYITKNIGSQASNGVITPISLVIKSIEFNYPESNTKIELGEYLFTGFDVEKQTVDALRGIDNINGLVKN